MMWRSQNFLSLFLRTITLLEFNIILEIIGRLFPSTSELKFIQTFKNKLCDEIDIACPILKFIIPLLQINILSEIIGRLFSSTSELIVMLNDVKLTFA